MTLVVQAGYQINIAHATVPTQIVILSCGGPVEAYTSCRQFDQTKCVMSLHSVVSILTIQWTAFGVRGTQTVSAVVPTVRMWSFTRVPLRPEVRATRPDPVFP